MENAGDPGFRAPTGDPATCRTLAKIHATGGDARRICDLFGLTVTTASDAAAVVRPGLDPRDPGSTNP